MVVSNLSPFKETTRIARRMRLSAGKKSGSTVTLPSANDTQMSNGFPAVTSHGGSAASAPRHPQNPRRLPFGHVSVIPPQ